MISIGFGRHRETLSFWLGCQIRWCLCVYVLFRSQNWRSLIYFGGLVGMSSGLPQGFLCEPGMAHSEHCSVWTKISYKKSNNLFSIVPLTIFLSPTELLTDPSLKAAHFAVKLCSEELHLNMQWNKCVKMYLTWCLKHLESLSLMWCCILKLEYCLWIFDSVYMWCTSVRLCHCLQFNTKSTDGLIKLPVGPNLLN